MAMNPRLLRPTANDSPASIPGLALWLDAAAADALYQNSDGTVPATAPGDPVGYWRDRSGNGRHATQSTAESRPVVGSQNGRKALTFDGSNDRLGTYTSALQPSSVFAVAKCTSSGAFPLGRTILGSDTSNQPLAWIEAGRWEFVRWGQNMSGPVAADSTINVLSATNDGTTSALFVNGGGNVTDSGGTFSSGALTVGAATDQQFFVGDICELLVYDRALNPAQRRKAEQYLARRWGITLAPQVANAEAQDWISRVYANGGTVSQSTASAVSTFCDAIEAAGIRDRFYRLGIFSGDNLNAALVPLYRNRAAYSGRNLIADNENYLGSSYTYSRLTPTSGGVGPTGGPVLTMTETAAAGVHVWRTNYSIPITVGATYTWSVYVKDVTNGLIVLRDSASRVALFDVSAESVVASAGGATGSIADAGGGWYRLSIEFSAVYNPGEFTVSGAPDGHSTATLPSYTGDTGHSFALSAPQLELGTLSAYDPTPLGNATDTNNAFVGVGTDYAETGSGAGLDGNGSTKYLDTGLAANFPRTDAGDIHLGAYHTVLPVTADFQRMIGASDTSAPSTFFSLDARPGQATPIFTYFSGGNGTSRSGELVGAGHFVGVNSVGRKVFRNGVEDTSLSDGAGTITTNNHARPFFVFAGNNTGTPGNYNNGVMAAYHIGRSMSNAQVGSLYTALQAFQTALGRNV